MNCRFVGRRSHFSNGIEQFVAWFWRFVAAASARAFGFRCSNFPDLFVASNPHTSSRAARQYSDLHASQGQSGGANLIRWQLHRLNCVNDKRQPGASSCSGRKTCIPQRSNQGSSGVSSSIGHGLNSPLGGDYSIRVISW